LVSLKYRTTFIDALITEIKNRKDYLNNILVDTIYFGGGTPSLLTISELSLIIKTVTDTYNLSPTAEITLEANPDDLANESIQNLKNYTNINRLSIGIQSFFDDDLLYLNRVHNSKQAIHAIENLISVGYSNITIDLIYGIPTLTEKKWKENLNRFFEFNIPHLSAYSLTVEPKTALDVQIRKNKVQNINENESIKHFEILLNKTENKDFINYEISNFAKVGNFSKHNSNYWLGKHYLGLGPSAHSYNGKSRQWNVSNIKLYCDENNYVNEIEYLTKEQQYNEYVLTSIRTIWGCKPDYIKSVFGDKFIRFFLSNINKSILENKVIFHNDTYTLTNYGKLFADGIASSLFYGL